MILEIATTALELAGGDLFPLAELAEGEMLLPDMELNQSLEALNPTDGDLALEGMHFTGEAEFPLDELSQNEGILSDRELNKSFSDNPSEASESIPDSISEYNEGMGKANKEAGCRRECEVEEELDKKYPESKGYDVISEAYLRNENGEIVQDPVSGERRRIDFVVVKDNSVVDSIEVTSETADKTQQMAKEGRIREAGGNYIRTYDGSLAKLPDDLTTHLERRA